MGGWAVAQSPILVTTITMERLRKRGYEALLAYYEKVAPSRVLGKPLYMFPIGKERSSRTYSGVRGSPRQRNTGGAVYSIVRSFFMSLSIFLFRYPESVVFVKKNDVENIIFKVTNNTLITLNMH